MGPGYGRSLHLILDKFYKTSWSSMESKQQQPHSAEYLGEHRDYWWNKDFLELMAKRWDLHNVHSVLDVGCGIGHWGQALSNFLPHDAKITGVDLEQQWVETAVERTEELGDRFTFKKGTAEKIPFPDHSFDMVTCQTLLIHLPNPKKALNEMYRVLKPGGLLVAVEPNNSITELVFDTLSIDEPAEDTLKALQFHVICERGQQLLGLGFDSLGDVIPGYFHDLGLNNIQVYLSDKTTPLFPPYAGDEQQIFIKQLEEWYEDDLMMWEKEESRKYFKAGGGNPNDFESLWGFLKERFRLRIEAIAAQTYSTSGGCLLYLISGRKPE